MKLTFYESWLLIGRLLPIKKQKQLEIPLAGSSINGSKPTAPERKMRLTRHVYREIRQSIGVSPAEQGGMLGSSDGGKTIDHYYWDCHAETSSATYRPNIEVINGKVLPEWNKNGIRLVGFVHSHPMGSITPSNGDKIYAKNLLNTLDEKRFYLPIVQSCRDGQFNIFGYGAEAIEGDLPAIHPYKLSIVNQPDLVNTPKAVDPINQ